MVWSSAVKKSESINDAIITALRRVGSNIPGGNSFGTETEEDEEDVPVTSTFSFDYKQSCIFYMGRS
jgi:hypothetical protein